MAAVSIRNSTLFADANLIGLWEMEGNSNDSKGSNNGTDTNMAYNASYGKFVQGALFNSTPNSFIQKTNPTGLPTGNSDLTVMVWANPRIVQSASIPCLLGFGAEGDYQMAGLGIRDVGLYWLGYNNDTSEAYSYATGAYTLFTATYVSATKTLQFYTNDSALGSGHVLTNTPNVGTAFVIFGIQRPGNAVYFDGQMDEGAIFSRVLSATEIANHYSGADALSSGFFALL